MKPLLISILILFANIQVSYGICQPDYILFEGKTYMLQFKPLKKYFEKHPNKSLSNHVIKQAYTATFEFKDNILTVKDIQIKAFVKGDKNAWKSIINQVFPDKLQRRLEVV